MKIGLNAHLLSNQAGYRSAGIHGYIHNILAHTPHLASEDWQFTAMVGGQNRALFDGVTMHRAPFDTESPAKRIIWEQCLQPIQLGQFDLYHAMAFVAPLMLSSPMVVTVYDLTFMRYPERLTTARRLYLKMFTALTCRRAKRVIAISQSTADDLTTLLDIPSDKIDVTPLGYDAKTYRPLPLSQLNDFSTLHNLPERFWLFVGTLEPRKNLVMLLNAYAKLSKSERLPLILGGGKGWMVDEIFATIERHGLSEEVMHIGFIPTEDLPLWYNRAEAFLYPSVFEGFGLPVLEAMACGTPVLTSNVSSLPEVAGEVGLTLPPNDEAVWADALRQVYQDNEWRASAREQGLQRAQQFTWERTAQLTLDSYRKALGN
jgi:glycosyltransferase involved in cell wall biosynthesis